MLCLKAYAKINWTLDILGTREDGYHLMDMLMQSVDMYDTLWIEEADTLILEDANQALSDHASQSGDELSSAASSRLPANSCACLLLSERLENIASTKNVISLGSSSLSAR